jgi:hypothetical protein
MCESRPGTSESAMYFLVQRHERWKFCGFISDEEDCGACRALGDRSMLTHAVHKLCNKSLDHLHDSSGIGAMT